MPISKFTNYSRVVAGTNLEVNSPSQAVPHASPVNSQINQFSLVNITHPIELKNSLPDELTFQNLPSSPQVGSSVSPTANSSPITFAPVASNSPPPYTFYTGLPVDQPTVVLSSEFIPIYELGINSLQGVESTKTEQGSLLSLKEEAKVLTAATAINALTQSIPFKNLVSENRLAALDFLSREGNSSDKTQFGSRNPYTSPIKFNLNITSYNDPSSSPPTIVKKTLKDSFGYELIKIDAFTETKLWLQSLHEIKRTFIGYTKSIESYTRSTSQDSSPTSISLTDSPPVYVLNRLYPQIENMKTVINGGSITQYVDRFADYSSKNYSKLGKYQSLVDGNFLGPLSVPYNGEEDRGAKICLSTLTKEATYSYRLKFLKNNLGTLGYDVERNPASSGHNYDVWDFLFGVIPPDASSDVGSTRGIQNLVSMGSLSKVNVTSPDQTVYVIESNTRDLGQSVVGKTGYDYYFEESVQELINNPSTNTFPRLQSLASRLNGCLEKSNLLFNMIGADSVSQAYLSSQESFLTEDVVQRLCKENSSPGWLYLTSSDLRQGVNSLTRLLSCIFKLSLNNALPESNRLKSYLFAWFVSELERDTANPIEKNLIDLNSKVLFKGIASQIINDNSISRPNPGVYQQLSVAGRVSFEKRSSLQDPNAGGRDVPERNHIQAYIDFLSQDVLPNLKSTQLFREILSILKDIKNSDIYDSSEKTYYSGIQKEQFLFSYFEVLLRILSLQTPESFQSFLILTVGNQKVTSVCYTGESSASRNSYFSSGYTTGPTFPSLKKVQDVSNSVSEDRDSKLRFAKFLKESLLHLKTSTDNAINDLARSFLKERIQNFSSLFNQVETSEGWPDSKEEARRNLTKISLSKEQIRLSEYIYTETYDRLYENPAARLLLIPTFKNIFPNDRVNLSDYLPNDSFSLSSFRFLSKYFKSDRFQPLQGSNKRIVSVGLPPGLLSSVLKDSSYSYDPSFVRIKVWKIDRLYPYVLFEPQTYHFDTNLFTNKNLQDWNNLSDEEDSDFLNVPVRYYETYDTRFSKYSGYNDFIASQNAFFSLLAMSNLLSLPPGSTEVEQIHREMYRNQAVSFLCEQYLKWYTDTDFDETQYYNFKPYSSIVAPNSSESTYQRVVEALATQGIPQVGVNTAQFVNKITGDVVSIPVSQPQNGPNQGIVTTSSGASVNLTDTTVSYLIETSLVHGADVYKKKVYYPKKFDRVLNIIVDPDDFEVNSAYYNSLPTNLKEQLVGPTGPFERINEDRTASGVNQPIRRKNTLENDVSFYEFFVTIEPLSPQ